MRRMNRMLVVTGLAFCLCVAPAVRADATNFRPYLVGARAAGMGGAFTALADDGSGAYYNPGGLAFAKRSSISLSGSVYGVVRGTYAGLIQQGQDFTYSSLNLFPVATGAIRKLDEENVLHFEVLVPDAVHINEHQSIVAKTNAFGYSLDSQTLWLGGGYARRFGRLGLGVSGFALVGSETTQLDFNAINAQDPGRFVAVTAREDILNLSFVVAAGARFDATDHLHFGLSVFSPAFGFGSRKEFIRILAGRDVGAPGNPPTSAVVSDDSLSATPTLPLRAQAGAAVSTGAWTFSADLVYLGSRSTTDDPDRASQGLDRRIVRNTVFNGGVGVEYLATPQVPLRLGLFTDLSASQSPQQIGAGPVPVNSNHVDRYGVSASAGMHTEHIATDVGMNVSYGTGTEYLPQQLDFTNIQPTAASQLYAYVFLATSYEF